MAKSKTAAPKLAFRAFQIDLGRVMERPEKIARIIKYGAELGYNALFLYGEGTLQYESHPECNFRTFLTKPQFRQLQALGNKLGVELIPIIPACGHT